MHSMDAQTPGLLTGKLTHSICFPTEPKTKKSLKQSQRVMDSSKSPKLPTKSSVFHSVITFPSHLHVTDNTQAYTQQNTSYQSFL